jgi:hypothetical protein
VVQIEGVTPTSEGGVAALNLGERAKIPEESRQNARWLARHAIEANWHSFCSPKPITLATFFLLQEIPDGQDRR